MIAAVYARKSTEQNGVGDEEKSVTRQIEHARAYAARKGWTVWIRVHRALAEHQIWLREPFTMAQAWVDLMRANYHKSHGRLDAETLNGCAG